MSANLETKRRKLEHTRKKLRSSFTDCGAVKHGDRLNLLGIRPKAALIDQVAENNCLAFGEVAFLRVEFYASSLNAVKDDGETTIVLTKRLAKTHNVIQVTQTNMPLQSPQNGVHKSFKYGSRIA